MDENVESWKCFGILASLRTQDLNTVAQAAECAKELIELIHDETINGEPPAKHDRVNATTNQQVAIHALISTRQ